MPILFIKNLRWRKKASFNNKPRVDLPAQTTLCIQIDCILIVVLIVFWCFQKFFYFLPTVGCSSLFAVFIFFISFSTATICRIIEMVGTKEVIRSNLLHIAGFIKAFPDDFLTSVWKQRRGRTTPCGNLFHWRTALTAKFFLMTHLYLDLHFIPLVLDLTFGASELFIYLKTTCPF